MIPVSTLAREGLLPVTMGMVLCNDDKMDAFVHMVQGLHAEGVVSSSARCDLTDRPSTSLCLALGFLSSSCLPSSTR